MHKLIICLLILSTFKIQAQNVVVDDGNPSAFSLSDVATITFNNGKIQFKLKQGGVSEFEIGQLPIIRFNDIATQRSSIQNPSSLVIYPNPFYNLVQIDLEGLEDYNGLLYVYNLEGKAVYTQNIQLVKSTIDLSTLSKGVYLLVFTNNNIQLSSKIFKL